MTENKPSKKSLTQKLTDQIFYYSSISGDLKSVVYCNTLKHKDYFEVMLKQLNQTKISNEKSDILMALGCSYDLEKLKLYVFFLKCDNF